MNLREDKGWTYGVRSSFEMLSSQGAFVVATGVRTDATGPAIQEIFKEIGKLQAEGVTPGELANVKSRYTLSLPGYFQTVSNIGDMLANIFVFNLPLDYYQQLPAKIARITTGDVHRVARKHLDMSRLSVVVVGDGKKVREQLSGLGRGNIEHRNADGAKITTQPPS